MELWDSKAKNAIQQAKDPSASADLAVVLMQEGWAHILLVGKSLTITGSQIGSLFLQKSGPSVAGYQRELNAFHNNVLQAFMKHINLKVVRCAVIASPGITRDQFHHHLILEANRRGLMDIIDNESRIILVPSTSGTKHSLIEVLGHPAVMRKIEDTQAAQEIKALKEFFAVLSSDSCSACYGLKHVEIAHENEAVKTLLITDDLIRSSDVATRERYLKLVKEVDASGGTVHVFSHVSGEELAQLTGIAAILRRSLPDLDGC